MPTPVFDILPDGTSAPIIYSPNQGIVYDPPLDPEAEAKEGEIPEADPATVETIQKMVTTINFPSLAPDAERQHVQVTVKDTRIPPQEPEVIVDPPPPPATQYKEYDPVNHTFARDITFVNVLLPLNALVKVKYAQTKTVLNPETQEPGEVGVKEAYVEFTVPNSPQMLTTITISYLGSSAMESVIPEIEPVPEQEEIPMAVAVENGGDESKKENPGQESPKPSESDD